MTITTQARLGHVHLRVADLDRALTFYNEVLGLDVVADGRAIGVPAAFLTGSDYHHELALNTFESAGGTPPPAGHTGLFHVAFAYSDSAALGRVVRRLLAHGYPIDHATDHGATVSVYLNDPEGNGVELYYDRPREQWFNSDGSPVLQALPLDVAVVTDA